MLPFNNENKKYARENRRQRKATRQEGVLWHCYLKSCRVHFYRQYCVDNYILDFYSPAIKLAIELDGSQHYDKKHFRYDSYRTERLEEYGIVVMRFANIMVDRYMFRVIDDVEEMIRQLLGEE